MSSTASDFSSDRRASFASAPLAGFAATLRSFRLGLQMRRLASETRKATGALEDRLRLDVGLGPNRPAPPGLPPMADAWMR